MSRRELPLRYDPDVYTGIVCHSELGYHKHSPLEAWTGMVVMIPLDGSDTKVGWAQDGMAPSSVKEPA